MRMLFAIPVSSVRPSFRDFAREAPKNSWVSCGTNLKPVLFRENFLSSHSTFGWAFAVPQTRCVEDSNVWMRPWKIFANLPGKSDYSSGSIGPLNLQFCSENRTNRKRHVSGPDLPEVDAGAIAGKSTFIDMKGWRVRIVFAIGLLDGQGRRTQMSVCYRSRRSSAGKDVKFRE